MDDKIKGYELAEDENLKVAVCKNVDTQSKRDAFIRYVSQCEDIDILLELLKCANEIIEERNNNMEKMPLLASQGS